jgi:hypothetical protein
VLEEEDECEEGCGEVGGAGGNGIEEDDTLFGYRR